MSPALVLSLVALFAALSTTGYAASIVPLAKRALTADKAKVATTANKAKVATVANRAKVADLARSATRAVSADAATTVVDTQTLGGQTAAQIAATPGPPSSLPASMFTYRTDSFELSQEGATTRVKAACQAGERVIAGGWDQSEGAAYVTRDAPAIDGSGWNFTLYGESGNNLAAIGTVWAVCQKIS